MEFLLSQVQQSHEAWSMAGNVIIVLIVILFLIPSLWLLKEVITIILSMKKVIFAFVIAGILMMMAIATMRDNKQQADYEYVQQKIEQEK